MKMDATSPSIGRGRLRNIAQGLATSFVSRNNDLDGYWALGKLRLLGPAVRLDLLAATVAPHFAAEDALLARQRAVLEKIAGATGVPVRRLRAVHIELDFEPAAPPAGCPVPGWGRLYEVAVSVEADNGAQVRKTLHGYCRPHDPRMETRSARYAPPA